MNTTRAKRPPANLAYPGRPKRPTQAGPGHPVARGIEHTAPIADHRKDAQSPSVRTAADQILSKVDAALSPLVEEINAYLKTLTGRRIPVATAQSDVEAIRRLVERAGCELFFGSRRVWLGARTRVGKNATFLVGTRIDKRQCLLHRTTDFPVLRARPIR